MNTVMLDYYTNYSQYPILVSTSTLQHSQEQEIITLLISNHCRPHQSLFFYLQLCFGIIHIIKYVNL